MPSRSARNSVRRFSRWICWMCSHVFHDTYMYVYYVGKDRIIIGPQKQNVSWYQLAATNKARRDERPSDLLLSWDFSWRGAGWNKNPTQRLWPNQNVIARSKYQRVIARMIVGTSSVCQGWLDSQSNWMPRCCSSVSRQVPVVGVISYFFGLCTFTGCCYRCWRVYDRCCYNWCCLRHQTSTSHTNLFNLTLCFQCVREVERINGSRREERERRRVGLQWRKTPDPPLQVSDGYVMGNDARLNVTCRRSRVNVHVHAQWLPCMLYACLACRKSMVCVHDTCIRSIILYVLC